QFLVCQIRCKEREQIQDGEGKEPLGGPPLGLPPLRSRHASRIGATGPLRDSCAGDSLAAGPTGRMDAPTAPVALITVLRERLATVFSPMRWRRVVVRGDPSNCGDAFSGRRVAAQLDGCGLHRVCYGMVPVCCDAGRSVELR